MVASRLELRLQFIGQKFILCLDSEAACAELTEGASNNSTALNLRGTSAAQFNITRRTERAYWLPIQLAPLSLAAAAMDNASP